MVAGIKTRTNKKSHDGVPRTKTGRQDRRHLRGLASVHRIIEATIQLIAEDGLANVTMQRIAERIGSSNALVVFHFGSKEKLFHAVLEYLNDQYASLWEKTVNRPGIGPAGRLIAAIDCAQHFMHEHPDWVAVWVLFSSDRQTLQLDRMISVPNDRAYLAQARDLLAEVARDERRTDVDVETLAKGLNYLVQGAWYWDILNPEKSPSDAMRKTAMALLNHAFPKSFPEAG